MTETIKHERHLGNKYEIIFSIFLIALAFLYRDNVYLVYPQVLYWSVLFLVLNLVVGLSLRLWPSKEWLMAIITMANCGVITAIISTSGGPKSNLWVLYLLPIYSVCLLLKAREVMWITVGVISFNIIFYFRMNFDVIWDATTLFDLGIRAGLFIFAAAAIWRISSKSRLAHDYVEEQRIELEKLEESMMGQRHQAKQLEKMADIGQLTSGVTHDLCNPLTVIYGTVKVLLEDIESHPHIKPDLERILRSTELSRTILGNLLTFARDRESEKSLCNIHDVLNESISLYQSTLTQSDISVSKEFSHDIPTVQASVSELHRVFLNLMANAKGVLDKGGQIHFRTEHVVPSFKGAQDWVRITVEDSGPGFPQSVLDSMFKPFNSTKVAGEGTGLGIYLAKEIVNEHRGSIQARNNSKGGAQIIITLPVSRNENQVAAVF